MDYNSELKNFLNGLKNRKKGVSSNQPIDKDLIQRAVELGYDDAKRTFKGINNYSNQKNKAFDNLKNSIFDFFNNSTYPNTQNDYNIYHEGWCKKFISDLSPFKISYGQAQKVINMAMKYLLCLSDAKKMDYFKYCHIALDSYILAWYNRQQLGKTKTSWSKLEETEYKIIQDKIYDYLKGGNGQYFKREFNKRNCSPEFIPLDKEPIKAEFVIWACETNFVKLQDAYNTLKKIGKSIDKQILTQADQTKI